MSPSPRRLLRLTQITPTRSWLHTTTHGPQLQSHQYLWRVSISTDGGLTFTRLTKANGQSPFDNTFGDPVVLYDKSTGFWVTVWLDGARRSGLGGYRTTHPEDPNSWTHFCAFNEGGSTANLAGLITTQFAELRANVHFLERL